MADDILDVMEERRRLKGRNDEQYRIKNGEIHLGCNRRKEQWPNEQCDYVRKWRNHGMQIS